MILSSEAMGNTQVNNLWEEPHILVKIYNIPKIKSVIENWYSVKSEKFN